MVAFRPNKTNERHQTKTETRHDDYDVDLHVFLWDDPHEDILWRKRQVKQRNRNNSLQNRNNKTETAHHTWLYIFIRCNFCPLMFGLVFAPPSCIGVRTLHPSRHLTSVFAPSIFLVCLSDDLPSYKLSCSSRHLFCGAGYGVQPRSAGWEYGQGKL